ncbi:MAG: S1/P1 nuclease [Cyclobacteriaceae bacterium]
MKKILYLLPALFLTINIASAWGVTGHRAVGLIAERHLTKKAKNKIKTILGPDRISMVSTWMDEIRSDSTYDYTADWHWVTVETGKNYEDSPKNPKGDVIQAIDRIIAELKTGHLSSAGEREYLKFLIHLVGDIHQPLHVGCCDDQGGNRIRVKWFREDSNLHRVWDSDMIDHTRLSYTELADAVYTPGESEIKKWQSQNVRIWANESMDLRPMVYDIEDGKLGYDYSYKYLSVVKMRISQAGIRLAGILNEIYG